MYKFSVGKSKLIIVAVFVVVLLMVLGSTGKSEICFSNGFVLLLDLAKCKEYCGTEENEETEGYPKLFNSLSWW